MLDNRLEVQSLDSGWNRWLRVPGSLQLFWQQSKIQCTAGLQSFSHYLNVSVGYYGKIILWQICRSSLLDHGTPVVRENDTSPVSWLTPFKDSTWDLDLKIFWCISKRFACLWNHVLRHSHESNHLNHFVLKFSPSYFSVRLKQKNRNFDSTLFYFFSFTFSGASPHTILFFLKIPDLYINLIMTVAFN